MTVTHNDNESIIGRAEINDIDAILAVPMVDPNEVEHVVKNNADTIFTWDYTLARPALRKLYEKAKTGQWNGGSSSHQPAQSGSSGWAWNPNMPAPMISAPTLAKYSWAYRSSVPVVPLPVVSCSTRERKVRVPTYVLTSRPQS